MDIRYRIFIVLLIIILFLACNKVNKQEELILHPYLKNYIDLIVDYRENIDSEDDSAEEIYKRLIHIPVENFELKTKNSFINSFKIGDDGLLPKPIWIPSPTVLDYAVLLYVYKNGDMWFSSMNGFKDSIYKKTTNQILYDEMLNKFVLFDDFLDNKKIYINDSYYALKFNKEKNSYYAGENIITKIEDYPDPFKSGKLIFPIISDKYIRNSWFSLKLKYNIHTRDFAFLLFNWKKNEVIKSVLLPGTRKYQFFNFGIGEKDFTERIYLKTFINFNNNYPGMIHGHIMIYDIFNDTMYNIRHPLMPDAGENEELLETNYILGEDENIYYQLVTDKAYYIYKIEPLWDEPMEETDYNPVFFEFYPELKAEWDNLQEQSE